MKYIDYKERKTQGTFNFPIAFYHQLPTSPRYHMPHHWHTQCEIIRIVSGTLHFNLDKNTKLYKEGDVIFVSSGMLHGGVPENCIYDCIVFDLEILLKNNHACTKTIHDIINQKIIIHSFLSEGHADILPLITKLCHTLASKDVGYEFMVQGYLYHLIGIILREHLYDEIHMGNISYERISSIKKVLSYIAENYQNDISLETLSKIAGMNPNYFCRYFRNMTERTPIDYLNYYRIECACEMLSTKNVSIRETAINCGFNDESYFIKSFRKYKGITPKQFIKNDFL